MIRKDFDNIINFIFNIIICNKIIRNIKNLIIIFSHINILSLQFYFLENMLS